MKKADYSKIAEHFDQARPLTDQNIKIWLDMISSRAGRLTDSRVLDLGCGTGRIAIPLAKYLKCRVTGADASEAMLSRAREKDGGGMVRWDRQDAGRLTYGDNTFDLVFMSHLLHHVESPIGVLGECRRVLVPGGNIFIRFGAIEQICGDVIHRFFHEADGIDRQRTPSVSQVEEWLKLAGFAGISSVEIVQRTFTTEAESLEAVRLRNSSVMSLISDECYEKGLVELKKYIEDHGDDPWLLTDKMTLTFGRAAID